MKNKKSIWLNIGDFLIRIDFHTSVRNFLRDEMYSKTIEFLAGFHVRKKRCKPQLHVIIRDSKGVHFRNHGNNVFSHFYTKKGGVIITHYHISFIQLLYILMEGIQLLLQNSNNFIFHASAIEIAGKAILFLGPPGAGKSTLVSLLRKYGNALADDSIIIKRIEHKLWVYQTPLVEKEWWIRKKSRPFPLAAIFILHKFKSHVIEPIADYDWLLKKVSAQMWTQNGKATPKQISQLFQMASKKDLVSILKFKKTHGAELARLLNNHICN